MPSRTGFLLLASALLLLATGFTACEHFSTVTVPASDTSRPNTWDGVWVDDQYVQLVGPTGSVDFRIRPGQTVLAVASALDSGGTQRLTMRSSFAWTCCRGDICSRTLPLTQPQVEEQAGSVGSSVSNGIWLYAEVTLPRCTSGFTLKSYSYWWSTEAQDFHGNRRTSRSHTISYP